ncbi:MAG: hypothetical protein HY063_02190 [Bacteroidetes bacterium]|nr:hypothetical protein [Bacteroidota bacterium]
MATYYWTDNTNSHDWNTAGNWSTVSGGTGDGAVPLSTDNAVFDVNSTTQCTVSTANGTCATIDFTNYTNTITLTGTLTVNGNVTFGASMVATGSSTIGLIVSGASTIKSNGFVWNMPMKFNLTGTKTLNGNLTLSGLLTISGATTLTPSVAETLTLTGTNGGINMGNTTNGAVKIIFTGGTWQGAHAIGNDTDLNGNVTIANQATYGVSGSSGITLTYVSGTITWQGDFRLNPLSPFNLKLNGTNLNNVQFSSSGGTVTLLNDLTCNGDFKNVSQTGSTFTMNSGNFNIGGGILWSSAQTTVINGTTKFILNGSNSRSIDFSGITTGSLQNSLEINISTTATLTIIGNASSISQYYRQFNYNTGTLKYTAGIVDTATNDVILFINASTTTHLDTVKMDGTGNPGTTNKWNKMTIKGTITVTLDSNCFVASTFKLGAVGGASSTTTTIAGGLNTIQVN